MALNNDVTNPAVISRFEAYFRHRDPNRHAIMRGDRGPACKNAKAALATLGFARTFGDEADLFDEELVQAVKLFQKEVGHRNVDGVIGPGTRSRLVSNILQEHGVGGFRNLDSSEAIRIPTVFICYAWNDSARVDKLDQWLRDRGMRVIRDTTSFKAGTHIADNILESILAADKVLAVYSEQSRVRDWPSFERQVAERVEQSLKASVLIYLRLDETPLKAPDPHRIAIQAEGKALKHVGLEVLKALDIAVEAPRFDYDEDAPL